MRWQKITGSVFLLFGVLGIVSGVLFLAVMAYYNAVHGPIEPSGGEYNSLDQIAFTGRNITRGCGFLLGGICGLIAGISWLKHNSKFGIVFGVAWFALGIIAATL